MANLYFSDASDFSGVQIGDTVEVVGEEARHAVRVSRLRCGEHTLVGDGVGTTLSGRVVLAEKDRFTLQVDTVETHPAPPTRLVLVQALAKGDRDERAIEQSTEFGVDEVVPWEAARSVSRWGSEKAHKGVAKWERIAREAAKQSMRAWIPRVTLPAQLSDLVELCGSSTARVLVMHPDFTRTLSEWARESLTSAGQTVSDIYIVIGPEGGLNDTEIEQLRGAGAEVLGLGATVLRTSSAGPAALAVLNVALRRW